MTRPCVFIVVPHPDDLEILVSHTAQYYINRGFQVYEILMTGGEYGIANRFAEMGNRLKGKKLQNLRIIENNRSKQRYGLFSDGTPKVISIRMGNIDGYLLFNPATVQDLISFFQKYRPTYIIGPDPVFSLDWHPDHMATARIVYFAVKKMPKKERPRSYYVFQTASPDTFGPIQSWDLFEQTCLAHRSQVTPIGIYLMRKFFRWRFAILSRNRFRLRHIDYKDWDKNQHQNLSGIIGYFVYHVMIHTLNPENLYKPTPEELGLR